jgi:hypothetical protein
MFGGKPVLFRYRQKQQKQRLMMVDDDTLVGNERQCDGNRQ